MQWTARIESPPPLPPRPEAAHKGDFGTVVVVGGCRTMIGAPAFCAAGALHIGAGRVRLAVPPDILTAALTLEPGATGLLFDGADAIDAALNAIDAKGQAVLAVGPGWGTSTNHGPLLETLWGGPRALVLDADGLNVLAGLGLGRSTSTAARILTPHPGEFRRLAAAAGIDLDPIRPSDRPAAAAALAQAHGAVVVLKGHRTIVSNGTRTYTNPSGNVALATAGSGDVLTGAIAGLLAQSMPPLEAATLGVYLHGAAADRWAQQYGPRGLTATRLVDQLVDAMAAYGLRD